MSDTLLKIYSVVFVGFIAANAVLFAICLSAGVSVFPLIIFTLCITSVFIPLYGEWNKRRIKMFLIGRKKTMSVTQEVFAAFIGKETIIRTIDGVYSGILEKVEGDWLFMSIKSGKKQNSAVIRADMIVSVTCA